MALQLERAMGRRVMIQRFPITMILFYCIKTATQPLSMPAPMFAPSSPAPHWLLKLGLLLEAPAPLQVPTLQSLTHWDSFCPGQGESPVALESI